MLAKILAGLVVVTAIGVGGATLYSHFGTADSGPSCCSQAKSMACPASEGSCDTPEGCCAKDAAACATDAKSEECCDKGLECCEAGLGCCKDKAKPATAATAVTK